MHWIHIACCNVACMRIADWIKALLKQLNKIIKSPGLKKKLIFTPVQKARLKKAVPGNRILYPHFCFLKLIYGRLCTL